MKKILIILILLFCGFYIFAEGETEKNTSDTQLQNQSERLLREANNQIGLPNIINFYEKKLLAMLYELRDREDLICYAYFFNEREGKLGNFIGKCVGYGLPYSVQFSSPEKSLNDKCCDGSDTILPQAEPNGLFMPDTLSATWLMLIDPETGDPRPVYIEPLIIVSPFPLREENK